MENPRWERGAAGSGVARTGELCQQCQRDMSEGGPAHPQRDQEDSYQPGKPVPCAVPVPLVKPQHGTVPAAAHRASGSTAHAGTSSCCLPALSAPHGTSPGCDDPLCPVAPSMGTHCSHPLGTKAPARPGSEQVLPQGCGPLQGRDSLPISSPSADESRLIRPS